eukprot:9556315-Alexandrium_andersonii.AAC.1
MSEIPPGQPDLDVSQHHNRQPDTISSSFGNAPEKPDEDYQEQAAEQAAPRGDEDLPENEFDQEKLNSYLFNVYKQSLVEDRCALKRASQNSKPTAWLGSPFRTRYHCRL